MFSRIFSIFRRVKGSVPHTATPVAQMEPQPIDHVIAHHHDSHNVNPHHHEHAVFGQGAMLTSALVTELELEANREADYRRAKAAAPGDMRKMEVLGVPNPEHYINKTPVEIRSWGNLTDKQVKANRDYATLAGPGTKSKYTD